ncbi:hypothetical protein [Candidatus Leptofilum sp.]|uniref:hypothetical protein n=1 Tax=Candidatus Leptofilum sp. TaxID=3241576 RepID=UPI003B5A23BE
MLNKNTLIRTWLLIGLLFAGFVLVACSGAGDPEPDADGESMEEMDDASHDHEDKPDRIPNEGGATISIISPEEGATFNTLDQVLIEVEVDNFVLGEDGNHWHVYVDGVSFGMVMGGNTDQALPGLDPGEHEVSVFMSIDTHEEYADGDSVTIVVEE